MIPGLDPFAVYVTGAIFLLAIAVVAVIYYYTKNDVKKEKSSQEDANGSN